MTPSTQQHALITTRATHVLGLAGPGSGKTWTMIQRIEALFKAGVDPARVACVTFTNAAAEEIQKRLADAGVPSTLGYVGTLHGLALRTLQSHGTPLGYGSRINVLDEATAAETFLACSRNVGCKASLQKLKDARVAFLKIRRLTGRKARTKEELAVVGYLSSLRHSSSADFDSLLEEFATLLEARHPTPAWLHLIVDEVQDSSDTDWRIYDAIPAENVFLIGDPDQAIYSFRGGNVKQLEERLHDGRWHTCLLEGNYRCAPAICEAANRLIAHQVGRVEKWTIPAGAKNQGEVGLVLIKDFKTADDEAIYVAEDIREAINMGLGADQIAVLARTHAVLKTHKMTAHAVGLPIREKTLRQWTQGPGWDQAVAILDFLNAPKSDAAAYRLQRVLHGKESADTSKAAAARAMASLASMTAEVLHVPDFTPVDQVPQRLARMGAERPAIAQVAHLIETLHPESISELLLTLHRYGFEEMEVGHGVTFATIHAAKGREWDTVYLVGWEEETIPGRRLEQLDEERRLAFVGVTRAERVLVITHAASRIDPYAHQLVEMRPSRFIQELLK